MGPDFLYFVENGLGLFDKISKNNEDCCQFSNCVDFKFVFGDFCFYVMREMASSHGHLVIRNIHVSAGVLASKIWCKWCTGSGGGSARDKTSG